MRLLMPQVTNVSKACMGNVELFPAKVQVAFPCQSSPTLTETCLLAISVSAQVFAVKSLGVASRGAAAAMKEIEITKDESGAPKVALHGEAKRAADAKGVKNVHISLSHSEVSLL